MITSLILHLWNRNKDIDKTKIASVVWFYISAFLGVLIDIAIIRILFSLS